MPKTRTLKKILHRLLPAFVSILLLVGIGHAVVGGLRGGISPEPGYNEGNATTKARREDRPSSTMEIARVARDIAELHLFGEIPKATPKPALPLVAPLESTLDLVLHGIIAASEKGRSLAIIADANGKQDSYSVGSMLSEGIILQEVNDEHVVLRNGNRLETLRMWNVSRDESQGSGGKFLATGGNPGSMMQGTPANRGGRAPRSYHNRRPRRLRSPPPPGYPAGR
uniref:Type IV pilus biogenesis n=1 Tax=Candidatus Kentrum sp. TC TaxID=2126339 RepID=A0A450YM63_9GAMM|nr:MAG: Type IV pilus biogenesis [Candidatus Kentron sp. TC]VFK42633.1 MAG: Type IV pilus biogenesis [Candidatus Kentron sp. TC]VFK57024.1 MAG: Type IV pilus biogenesis [Candidatus Kentron sp. TC]